MTGPADLRIEAPDALRPDDRHPRPRPPTATAWTLARILQYALWDVERDYTMWHTEPDRAIARILLDPKAKLSFR